MVNRHYLKLNAELNVKILESNYFYSYFLTQDDKLYVTGRNDYAMFGISGNKNAYTEVIDHPPNIKQLVGGSTHTILLTESNELYVCGYGRLGQLGFGNNYINTSNFTKVDDRPFNIKEIYGQASGSILRTDIDELYVSGYNNNGELGLGDKTNRISFTKVTNRPDSIKHLLIKNDGSIILTDTNELWVCGWNNYGQKGLDNGTSEIVSYTKITIPNIVIKKLYGYYYHTFLLTDTNELWACGRNDRGQLGLGDKTDRHSFTKVTNRPANIKSVLPGFNHTILLTESNELWVCGSNEQCQLGLSDNEDKPLFVKYTGFSEYLKDIKVGAYNNIILSDSDELYVIGYNYYGQLGLGDTENRTSYTKVEVDF